MKRFVVKIKILILIFFLSSCSIGKKIDEFNEVPVHYNGILTTNADGANRSSDGYLFGLKWQCVEFVKRYYYTNFNHRMPNVYGNAKDFFKENLKDGMINKDRGLIQYKNGGNVKPKVGDLIVFTDSKYGHVAIVSDVNDGSIEVVQQNVWIISRWSYDLENKNGKWFVNDNELGNPAGWLRKQ